MQNLLPLRMLPLLSAVILIMLVLMLSGCASTLISDCAEPNPLPKTLTEPSLPRARSYSEKVLIYFQKVEAWLSKSEPSTTP